MTCLGRFPARDADSGVVARAGGGESGLSEGEELSRRQVQPDSQPLLLLFAETSSGKCWESIKLQYRL